MGMEYFRPREIKGCFSGVPIQDSPMLSPEEQSDIEDELFQHTRNTMNTNMRRFNLERLEDESGISGTGIVAEGIEFWDGTCAIRWKTKHRCTAVYDSVLVLEAIHGHGGKTKIVWIDK